MLRSSDFPVQTTSAWATTRWALGIGLAALLVVFSPTWIAMAKVWTNSETYGHGMAVAPIAVWLIWRQRAQIAALTPSVSWVGVAGLAVCCLGWLAAELAGINVVMQFALTGMIVCLVLALAGWDVAKATAFPLLFLFFMVPAGEVFNPPLMDGTANATVWALQMSGIPVYREGMNFALPTGRWSVVEACSGLRYVLAAAMLGALFAYLNFERWSQRTAFFGASIAVSVLANWMRAYLIVLVGHFSNMKWGVGDDHVVYGWVFFGITMFVLFWMGAKWRDANAPSPDRTVRVETPKLHELLKLSARNTKKTHLFLLVSLCVVLGGRVVSEILKNVTPISNYGERVQEAVGELKVTGLAFQPRYRGARTVSQGTPEKFPEAEIYSAYFANQKAGYEMIATDNLLNFGETQSIRLLSREIKKIMIGDEYSTVVELRVSCPSGQRLAWYWYGIGGEISASETKIKILTALKMIRGGGDHSAVTLVSVPIQNTKQYGLLTKDDLVDRQREVLQSIATKLKYVVP